MSIFDPIASMDWNGDGKIDSWDDAMEYSMMRMTMDRIDRDDRIQTMVRAINESDLDHIGNEEFEELCRQKGLRISQFTQDEVDEIARIVRNTP